MEPGTAKRQAEKVIDKIASEGVWTKGIKIEDVIGAYIIKSRKDAYEATRLLVSVQNSPRLNKYTLGVIISLNKRHERQVYGALHQDKLREYRKLLGFTQSGDLGNTV